MEEPPPGLEGPLDRPSADEVLAGVPSAEEVLRDVPSVAEVLGEQPTAEEVVADAPSGLEGGTDLLDDDLGAIDEVAPGEAEGP